ncbi:MAG TPA: CHAD domain-containing protein [Aggregatilineales bacterium]|nr:CHAD domain-containing protein [Aggregatilineales bacterium]
MLKAPSLATLPDGQLQSLEAGAAAERIGMSADDPMSEAGRKALMFYFVRLLKYEPTVGEPGHEDDVHDMRVASRRLRSVLQLFGEFYQDRTVRPFRRTLRRVATALGQVRDLEVLKLNADTYLKANPGQDLAPLVHDWETQLEQARADLNGVLRSRRYRDFVADFTEFVTTTGAGATVLPTARGDLPVPYQIRHVVPRLIYEHYTAVRAYETILPEAPLDTLHALRIESKRLRYALETFEEVMGSRTTAVITQVKLLQDHLGTLQDARVASGLIHDFVMRANEGQSLVGVRDYLSYREREKQTLREGVMPIWKSFTRPMIRRALGAAVAEL